MNRLSGQNCRSITKFIKISKLKNILFIVCVQFLFQGETLSACSGVIENHKCSCYKLEDGIYIECSRITLDELAVVLDAINGSIQSLTVRELDGNVHLLPKSFVPGEICIKNLCLTQTIIRDIEDETFLPLRNCLETLSLLDNKIQAIPLRAFSGLAKVISIDFESNNITELPSYSFYGLPLIKLNLRGNKIKDISVEAFLSLEQTLSELDLSKNDLKHFPITAIVVLQHLRSLRLPWNSLSSFPISNASLDALEYLDISSNRFVILPKDCFLWCPSIKMLNFQSNELETVHKFGFRNLKYLESINLSWNKIKSLNKEIFKDNKNIRSVNLIHNHIHHVRGLFSNLPNLVEVFVSHNNILEVPSNTFVNSTILSVIYLDNNSIRSMHTHCLQSQFRLSQLDIENNFIVNVPHNLFYNKTKLTLISLGNNKISNLEPNTMVEAESLREIRLNFNVLSKIKKELFAGKGFLQDIYLQNNEISNIEVNAFKDLLQLRYLDLRENKLTSMAAILPKGLSSLMLLYIDFNDIVLMDNKFFAEQKHLQVLRLNNNHITEINFTIFQNLKKIERLYLQNNYIKKIGDGTFSSMKTLKILNLSKNLLTKIDVDTFLGLTELEDLTLSQNLIDRIASKSLNHLKKIRKLDLSDNFLKVIRKDVFVAGLPLRILNLKNCSLYSIEEYSFKGLNNLNSLNLSNNNLTAEQIGKIVVTSLSLISISSNIFSDLKSQTLDQFPLLENINMDNCDVHIVPEVFLRNIKNLKKISISNNHLSFLNASVFQENTSITHLDLSQNFFNEIPYVALLKTKLLENLDFSDNFLQTINFDILSSLRHLKFLDLKNNQIKSFIKVDETYLPELISLDLSINNLFHVPNRFMDIFPYIQRLNISNNKIQVVQSIINFNTLNRPRIINIDMGRNPINYYESNGIQDHIRANIYELYIYETNLTVVSEDTLKHFPNIQFLYAKSNYIRMLHKSPFITQKQLQNIDLSCNMLSIIETQNFLGLNKLYHLNLSRNSVSHIEYFSKDLENLVSLDLSHNEIAKISSNCFSELAALSDLALNSNELRYLNEDMFASNKKLKRLNLMGNLMEFFSPTFLNTIELHVSDLKLEGNPIDCNCDMHGSWSWAQDHMKILQKSPGTCAKPFQFKGKAFFQVDMSEICDVPTIYELAIEELSTTCASISWQVRNDTGVKAFRVAYYSEDNVFDMRIKTLSSDTHTTNIDDLEPYNKFIFCVTALYEDNFVKESNSSAVTYYIDFNSSIILNNSAFFNASTTECIKFWTDNQVYTIKTHRVRSPTIDSILTRRLGLIVGCCLGVITFVVLASVLGYVKTSNRQMRIQDLNSIEFDEYRYSVHSSNDILTFMQNNSSTDNILLGIPRSDH